MNNQPDKFENFSKAGKNVRLHENEKLEMRERLLKFMAEHPLSDAVRKNAEDRLHNSRGIESNFINLKNLKTNMGIAILIALFVGGGATFAAENAVPGDALYPVKISLNENVKGALAVSLEAKAKYQARLASERLLEAEKLAAKGDLDAETTADLKARFEKHYEKSRDRMAELTLDAKLRAAADVSSDLEAAMRAHERILVNVDGRTGVGANVDVLLGSLRAKQTDAVDIRTKIEAEISKDPSGAEASATGAMKSAENKIAEVKRYIESNSSKVSAEVKAEAEAEVKVAESFVVEGKAKVEAKAYAEAFAAFKAAHRKAQEAKHMVTSDTTLKLDLRVGAQGNVDVKTGVTADTNASATGTIDIEVPGVGGNVKLDSNTNTRVQTGDLDGDGRLDVQVGI